MPFSVNDKVRLSDAAGGWEGFVGGTEGAPGGAVYYQVYSPNWGDPEEGKTVVLEADIAAGPLTAPTFNVNDDVTLYGMAGTVTADNGDGTFDIEVDWTVNRHMELTRIHTVPLWRLAIENT